MERRPSLPRSEASESEADSAVRELFSGKPDAIFVLSMGIVPRENDPERFKSTTYADVDSHGLLGGGKAAVIAGAEAYKAFPDATLVTDSYTAGKRHEEPTHAAVMARELEVYGVPKESIVLEEESISTSTELVEMIRLADEHGWNRIAVIVNDFHHERTKEMYERLGTLFGADDETFLAALERFRAREGSVEFVDAEDILKKRDPRYGALIEKVHESEAYQARIASEKRGTEQLRDGTYGKRAS